jgi:hypothetical protein
MPLFGGVFSHDLSAGAYAEAARRPGGRPSRCLRDAGDGTPDPLALTCVGAGRSLSACIEAPTVIRWVHPSQRPLRHWAVSSQEGPMDSLGGQASLVRQAMWSARKATR